MAKSRKSRPVRKAAAPKSAKAAAWRAEFGRLAKAVQAYQAQHGCSLKAAWAAVRGGARANPSYWPYEGYEMQDAPYGAESFLPTNRRNPGKGRKVRAAPKSAKAAAWRAEFGRLAKAVQLYQAQHGCSLKAAWAAVRGGAVASNPRAGFTWPYMGYEQDIADFGPDSFIPVNRRNPKGSAGGVTIARFPGTCAVCGGAFVPRVDQITDSGIRGPQGGKKMKHVGC